MSDEENLPNILYLLHNCTNHHRRVLAAVGEGATGHIKACNLDGLNVITNILGGPNVGDKSIPNWTALHQPESVQQHRGKDHKQCHHADDQDAVAGPIQAK